MKDQNARQCIMDAASKLFAEKGYVETTTRAVANAANVSETTIFRIFGSKKKLFQEIYLANTPSLDSLLLNGLTNGKNLREDLRLLFREYTVTYIQHIPNYRLSMQQIDELYGQEFYLTSMDRLENMKIQLLTYLNLLKSFGQIADIDCAALSEFLFSTFLIKAPEFIRDKGPDDEYNEEMVEQFVDEYSDYVYKLVSPKA